MPNLSSDSIIAKEIKSLSEQGIALIPVGEKDKKARVKWGEIESPLSLLKLYDLLGKFDTNAVAMICGKPSSGGFSDGLFVIDFDVKNKRELGDGAFLNLFRSAFGYIDKEFLYESTPSGGVHIVYRVSEKPKDVEFTRKLKLASRESTPEELISNPQEKEKCFIEGKGAGQICQCYPSPGYLRIESGVIGCVSWEDHIRILEFLSSFNECVKEVKQKVNPSRDTQTWYKEGENPFDEYNLNHNGGLLEEDGWIKSNGNVGRYQLFCRPGSKKSYWIGASYDTHNRMYNIFTTSSQFDCRSYNPSDILCIIKHGGDKSELYNWLVSQGYGKLKKSVETRLIKSAAKYGNLLPANISDQAKSELEKEKENVANKYPHGVFWNIDEDGKVEISQKKLDAVIISLGFRNIVSEGLVYVDGYLVKKVEESRIFHHLINYILRVDGFLEVDEVNGILEKIDESERSEVEDIYNEYSSFINKYGKITIEHLKEFGKIKDGKIVVSSKTESFKFYKNCYVSITSDGVEVLSYNDLGDRLILEHLILNREFKLVNDVRESRPYQFFNKAVGIDNSFLTILGYLTHDFIDDSMNAIFVGLGTPGCGKNILFNILNHVTSVHVIDGRQVELDKNLLQSYNFERILVISDVEERFKYDFFKNFSSGAASLKKLYKDVVVLKRKKMPKPVVLTNFSYKMVEGLERRIIDIEFKDFFSKIKGGVATYFGMMFPGHDLEDKGGWTEFDWNCFDSIILSGICAFLKSGSVVPRELTENSWYKRFESTYHHLLEFFNEKFDEWASVGKVKCASFDDIYISWCRMRNIRTVFSSQKYNKALMEYSDYLGYDFDKDKTLRDENSLNVKFKVFKKRGVLEIKEEEKPPF